MHLGEIDASARTQEHVLRLVRQGECLAGDPMGLPRAIHGGVGPCRDTPPPDARLHIPRDGDRSRPLCEIGRGLRVALLECRFAESGEEIRMPLPVLRTLSRVLETLLEHVPHPSPISGERFRVSHELKSRRAESDHLT